MGVQTRYTDGLGTRVSVAPETLVRICAAMGATVTGPHDAAQALRGYRATANTDTLPPVIVAWDGVLPSIPVAIHGAGHAQLQRSDGEIVLVDVSNGTLRIAAPIPLGYHELVLESPGKREVATVIAAPTASWHPFGSRCSWGLGAQLSALRSRRSRAVGDLRDLRSMCDWIGDRGGDLITVLPLLPTFNDAPAEPSPYSPVSRLFWSELILDLGDAHRPAVVSGTLDVTAAAAEVAKALAGQSTPDVSLLDEELIHYARFRGAQARLGRNWRVWPRDARNGKPRREDVDESVERFHLVAQTMARQQLGELRAALDRKRFRLGLDLAVGVHPDGYDPWSRQSLFADGISVGAPPDTGFPSGQNWGFSPVLPASSRRDGHRYLAASIAHQAGLAGVLRVDHIMALARLYWIPHELDTDQGTYVSYPAEELFAILTLESHRNRCEVVGENLGNVPRAIDEALPRHRIWGMYLATFQTPDAGEIVRPTAADVVLVGTHDTPTFAGWLDGSDIADRVRYGLLNPDAVQSVTAARRKTTQWLATQLGCRVEDPREFLAELLTWLGGTESPLVIPWVEDLWLEDRGVNLPGTPSSVRPNWQRPMSRLLDDIMTDPLVAALLHRLQQSRTGATAVAKISLT